MSQLIEVKVPDIGDFADVPVIEILVKVGDTVDQDQSLVTLESDKATMDVPSSHAGIVKEIKVKVGDTVAEGKIIVLMEISEAASSQSAPASSSSVNQPVPTPVVNLAPPQPSSSNGRGAN